MLAFLLLHAESDKCRQVVTWAPVLYWAPALRVDKSRDYPRVMYVPLLVQGWNIGAFAECPNHLRTCPRLRSAGNEHLIAVRKTQNKHSALKIVLKRTVSPH
jgi:hypothetical protein